MVAKAAIRRLIQINHPHPVLYAVLLAAGAVPLAVIGFWSDLTGGRSVESLAVADRCVTWAHRPRAEREQESESFIDKCNLYFRVRSEHDADEDEVRFKARSAPAPTATPAR